MRFEFESIKSFERTLAEIDLLITESEVNQTEELRYATYNKSAVLLLTAKFENYLESIVDEYILNINKLGIKASLLPTKLKIRHTFYKLKNLDRLKQDITYYRARKTFKNLGLLWSSSKIYKEIAVDSRFDYGEHGSNEIEKLFKKIGFNDIFSKIKVYKKTYYLTRTKKEEVDFKGVINSVIHIRNNIIHKDATPSLTHLDIKTYQDYFRQFGKGISKLLKRDLKVLKRR